ncbi:zinc metallopeptidase [Clostridium sartagoforme]|uniref:Zinc metallopeptidase n=1 Tax=Clostridium sartagoforme TaxID=84031 RepID=A0A4S2DNJ3_9CLOT|nr:MULTISPECIES: zinc metallopeptidase [Clostridium]MBS5937692.1 zinc metallopeptidase [Clostridium sp.]TGY43929.1 zinc metallopeptidase [Clostridium sartagoforme]
MFYPGFYFDTTYLILIPAVIIAFWAQNKIDSAYKKYSTVRTMSGVTGSEVARSILDGAGLFDVRVERYGKHLGDHYDPSKRVIRLSPEVYDGATVASAGIAAHECGHAIQHQNHYAPLVLRTRIAPIVNIGSNVSIWLFMIGIFLGNPLFANIGIIFFSGAVIYQLVTLPVEFNASTRALSILKTRTFLYGDELKGAQKVLDAAAMTYVAATLMAISQLIRLIALNNRYNDN